MSIKRKWPLILILIASLFALQGLFFLLAQAEGQRVFKGAASLFRIEEVGANPYRISQEILDITDQGIFRCPQLYNSKGEMYLDRRDLEPCTTNFFLLEGVLVEMPIRSVNGEDWLFKAFVPQSPFFSMALWSSRLALVLLFGFIINLQRSFRFQLELEKKTSKKIEEMAIQVAHDLRSPLSALNVIASKIASQPTISGLLSSAVDRLNTIAEDLLESKGPKKIEISEFHVLPVLDQIVNEKRLVLGDKSTVLLSLNSTANSDLCIGDPDDFGRVVSNLLNNSLESMGSEGGHVEVFLSSEGDDVFLKISDNGKGIPQAFIPFLGTKGFSRGKPGTGVGLYHAKSQMEKWGGGLDVQSQVGKGTTVTLRLHR